MVLIYPAGVGFNCRMHRMPGAQQVLALAGRVVGMFVRVRGRSAGCEERCGRGASSEALASDPGSRASIGTGRVFSHNNTQDHTGDANMTSLSIRLTVPLREVIHRDALAQRTAFARAPREHHTGTPSPCALEAPCSP